MGGSNVATKYKNGIVDCKLMMFDVRLIKTGCIDRFMSKLAASALAVKAANAANRSEVAAKDAEMARERYEFNRQEGRK